MQYFVSYSWSNGNDSFGNGWMVADFGGPIQTADDIKRVASFIAQEENMTKVVPLYFVQLPEPQNAGSAGCEG